MTAHRSLTGRDGLRTLLLSGVIAAIAAATGVAGCGLFKNEMVSRGEHLYAHYCAHCHGENGRQNEGYNWAHMPDPRPKDLSNKGEMSTFKDDEIFFTIYRDMKDTTPDVGDKIGDDEFAVPTMPTFKYTLSEEEIWSIVAYVRTLHGMKLTYDLNARKKEIDEKVQAAQRTFDQAKQALEAAEKKAQEEAEKKGTEVDDAATEKEQQALAAASKELEEAKALSTAFSSRPKPPAVARPDLTMPPDQAAKLADVGKRLYRNKYGCNGCHRVAEEGGVVGPALDRAGFRLNPPWVYRWVKYPQGMKPETRMPTLGLNDQDAKAVAMYLTTLKAPKPDQPITKAGK